MTPVDGIVLVAIRDDESSADLAARLSDVMARPTTYLALARLRNAELVRMFELPARNMRGGRVRIAHALTPKGRAAKERWWSAIVGAKS